MAKIGSADIEIRTRYTIEDDPHLVFAFWFLCAAIGTLVGLALGMAS